jgi:peptidylprolyl isomerase
VSPFKNCFLAWALLAASAGSAAAGDWWQLDAKNTLVIDTTKGRMVVEMRPDFAPTAVARIKLLAHEHFYDGLLFHRVLDHYVDQTGNPNNHDSGTSHYPNLKPEFRVLLAPSGIDAIATQSSDGITGFVGATPFAASASPQHPGSWRAWGAYCPGVAGMGREEGLDTANSEIFFMRDASRSLDHDYTVWGRVVQGLDVVRAMAVGEPPAHPDRMVRVRVMADLPENEQPRIEVIDTHSATFAATMAALRRNEGADFTLCDVPVAIRALNSKGK